MFPVSPPQGHIPPRMLGSITPSVRRSQRLLLTSPVSRIWGRLPSAVTISSDAAAGAHPSSCPTTPFSKSRHAHRFSCFVNFERTVSKNSALHRVRRDRPPRALGASIGVRRQALHSHFNYTIGRCRPFIHMRLLVFWKTYILKCENFELPDLWGLVPCRRWAHGVSLASGSSGCATPSGSPRGSCDPTYLPAHANHRSKFGDRRFRGTRLPSALRNSRAVCASRHR
jgi:hypothetical protein